MALIVRGFYQFLTISLAVNKERKQAHVIVLGMILYEEFHMCLYLGPYFLTYL